MHAQKMSYIGVRHRDLILSVACSLLLLACGRSSGDDPAQPGRAAPDEAEPAAAASSEPAEPAAEGLYAQPVTTIDGRDTTLADYRGKAMLIVNTASQCGYTPQYEGLQALYEAYKDKGLVVLGFPSNDFGAQEPGSDTQIQSFVKAEYGVTFPMFSKVQVKGDGSTPLYQALVASDAGGGKDIGWNFTKFVVDRQGRVVARFDSAVTPQSPELMQAVQRALAE